jgi:hypothetical protein
MGIGTSIFLIAVGAILRWAVTGHVAGLRIDTVGLILLIVGAVGLVISLFWATIWADRRRRGYYGDPVVDPTVPPPAP